MAYPAGRAPELEILGFFKKWREVDNWGKKNDAPRIRWNEMVVMKDDISLVWFFCFFCFFFEGLDNYYMKKIDKDATDAYRRVRKADKSKLNLNPVDELCDFFGYRP